MRRAALAAALLLAAATGASAAELVVGAGAILDLGTGSLDLGCADLRVDGTLLVSDGAIEQARDVTTSAGGTLQGGSGMLELAGDWSSAGAFGAGAGTVSFVDGCERTLAVISGDHTFEHLSMLTSSGKEYRFEAGSTQTIRASLLLLGTAGNLLVLRSTVPGSEATFDLRGGFAGDYIDVDDVHASPKAIEPGAHSVTGANASGWSPLALPALSLTATVLLALALLCAGFRARISSRSPSS